MNSSQIIYSNLKRRFLVGQIQDEFEKQIINWSNNELHSYILKDDLKPKVNLQQQNSTQANCNPRFHWVYNRASNDCWKTWMQYTVP